MAKSSVQLFDVFAARVAEILRERYRLEPEALLRVRRQQFAIEGLVRTATGGQRWHLGGVTAEQLEWQGPNAMAEAFVREYAAALAESRQPSRGRVDDRA